MSVFLTLFLFFSSFTVKANEIVFPSFPSPVEDMTSTHYLIFVEHENDTYYLFKPLDPSDVDVTIPSIDYYYINFNGPAIIYKWKEGETSWQTYKEITSYGVFSFDRYKYFGDDSEFLYSSFDLYFKNSDIFFQRAPIKANFLDQMREVKMGAMMETVVYLIPLLIALLVSLIAFRKAWAWLLKVLRTA